MTAGQEKIWKRNEEASLVEYEVLSSPHRPHVEFWQQCSSSGSRWGHSSSWLSRWLLWGSVRRVVGFISVWYEMLSRAPGELAGIDSLRWSTATKQLSGPRRQNEYRRRLISAGPWPSVKHHSQPTRRLNSGIESSRLIYYPECKGWSQLEEQTYEHTPQTGNLSRLIATPAK